MLKQKKLIDAMDWDVLIILDACRCDAFCNIFKYKEVIRVDSDATATPEWLKKTWTKKYDNIIYLSGNPFVNSKGVKTNDNSFVGGDHFEVKDCWDGAFNKKTGRIESSAMKMYAIGYLNALKTGKKLVIHFMQPHSPYIFGDTKHNSFFTTLSKIIPMRQQLLLNKVKFIRKLKPRTESTYSEYYTDKEIKEAYMRNLESAREDVEYVVNQAAMFGFKVVITADHGELFGEYERYGHGGKVVPELISVPWIEVGGVRWN